MKTKRLLLIISAISLLSIVFTSCEKDDMEMGIGETGGPGRPGGFAPIKNVTDSMSISNFENFADFNIPKD